MSVVTCRMAVYIHLLRHAVFVDLFMFYSWATRPKRVASLLRGVLYVLVGEKGR